MTMRTVLFSGLLTGVLGGVVTASPPPAPASHSRGDQEVARCFRSVLERDPHPYELRRYAVLMNKHGWTEQDVRKDLTERSDYRRHSARSALDTNAIVTRAYGDILGREPDAASMRSYHRHMVHDGWSEADIREALRQSPEYRSTARRTASAERIVRRAYQDILDREPDSGGMNTYRQNILDDGWDEQDVRMVLWRSDERRGQAGGTTEGGRSHVAQMVRNAYLAVLHREPDATGLRDYGERVVRDNWSQADIEKSLRDSPEFSQRRNR